LDAEKEARVIRKFGGLGRSSGEICNIAVKKGRFAETRPKAEKLPGGGN
jgi:hypothetical protein